MGSKKFGWILRQTQIIYSWPEDLTYCLSTKVENLSYEWILLSRGNIEWKSKQAKKETSSWILRENQKKKNVEHKSDICHCSNQTGLDTRSMTRRSLFIPPVGQDMTSGQLISGVYPVWIQSFPSCLTKTEELSLAKYLPIAGWRIIGFIPFQRVLVLCEMQSASSRILTRITVSIPTTITIIPRTPQEWLWCQ